MSDAISDINVNNTKARIIAFYLPQYHPITENNEWWGKGFTEWTNVGRAKPLFKGHYQPRVPADLGYYDLRIAEIREEQAIMAKNAGIYGFCYWHYWFGNGKRLLEKPFNEVLDSGKPEYPFCLGWANESWEAKVWNANDVIKNKVLIEQKYPGKADNEIHFYQLLKAFKDNRYITVDKKPIFLIYKPELYKNIDLFIKEWNELAVKNGIDSGLYFVAHTSSFINYDLLIKCGFNAVTVNPISRVINHYNTLQFLKIYNILRRLIFGPCYKKLTVIKYSDAINYFINLNEDSLDNVIPTIIPNWDHSPRSGKNGLILIDSTPKLFEKCVNNALQCVRYKPHENKIIFLKSWNEWAEGNYIEPDIIFGHQYLDVIKNIIFHKNIF